MAMSKTMLGRHKHCTSYNNQATLFGDSTTHKSWTRKRDRNRKILSSLQKKRKFCRKSKWQLWSGVTYSPIQTVQHLNSWCLKIFLSKVIFCIYQRRSTKIKLYQFIKLLSKTLIGLRQQKSYHLCLTNLRAPTWNVPTRMASTRLVPILVTLHHTRVCMTISSTILRSSE